MDRAVQAGIYGFILGVIINLFLAQFLGLFAFILSFLAAIFVIYIFRLETLREGLVAAFMTYIFTDGILGTMSLLLLYLENKPYPAFNVDIFTIFYPIASSISAFIAGYVGVRSAPKKKQTQEFRPSPPPPIPPV
jgi:hypothetical protein